MKRPEPPNQVLAAFDALGLALLAWLLHDFLAAAALVAVFGLIWWLM